VYLLQINYVFFEHLGAYLFFVGHWAKHGVCNIGSWSNGNGVFPKQNLISQLHPIKTVKFLTGNWSPHSSAQVSHQAPSLV